MASDIRFASDMKPVKKRDTVVVYSFVNSRNKEVKMAPDALPKLRLPLFQ
jgi:hypothetical protein